MMSVYVFLTGGEYHDCYLEVVCVGFSLYIYVMGTVHINGAEAIFHL